MHPDLESPLNDNHQTNGHAIVMSTPTDKIVIHEGAFTLRKAEKVLNIYGIIEYVWFPKQEIWFYGMTSEEFKFPHLFGLELYVESQRIGLSEVAVMNFKDGLVNGVVTEPVCVGKPPTSFDSVSFSIPNLRRLTTIHDGHTGNDSFSFENEHYLIEIAPISFFEHFNVKLSRVGGYMITHHGKITKKVGTFKTNNLKDLEPCLNEFLSFLNGRKTAILFKRGIVNDKVFWTDYTVNKADSFVRVDSPFETRTQINLNHVWSRFYDMWNDGNSRNFIEMSNHWYFETNKDSGQSQVSIIIAQTGLELICNWLLIEKMRILVDREKDVAAATKIRMLLTILNVSLEIPSHYKDLIVMGQEKRFSNFDGPAAITKVRNTLNHAGGEGIRDFKQMNSRTLLRIRKLALWYIEVALLYIYDYDGEYLNRCTREVEPVPYKK